MNDFLFLRPLALWLFIPFFALVYWYVRNRNSTTIWSQSCSPDLLPYILAKKGKRQRVPFLLALLTGSLLITALAGPSWERISEPLLKTQEGLVIALDLSKGMDAQDIKPSRLQRAVYKISDLLALRREGQTALIVFSGDPFVVTPFTDDTCSDQSAVASVGHHDYAFRRPSGRSGDCQGSRTLQTGRHCERDDLVDDVSLIEARNGKIDRACCPGRLDHFCPGGGN